MEGRLSSIEKNQAVFSEQMKQVATNQVELSSEVKTLLKHLPAMATIAEKLDSTRDRVEYLEEALIKNNVQQKVDGIEKRNVTRDSRYFSFAMSILSAVIGIIGFLFTKAYN